MSASISSGLGLRAVPTRLLVVAGLHAVAIWALMKVAESSGSSRLDQAAMSEARSHWRLRPATRNGVPFEQWLTLRVVFHLENR
jgi:hypothetical protein